MNLIEYLNLLHVENTMYINYAVVWGKYVRI